MNLACSHTVYDLEVFRNLATILPSAWNARGDPKKIEYFQQAYGKSNYGCRPVIARLDIKPHNQEQAMFFC
jgi:hypothetical protein